MNQIERLVADTLLVLFKAQELGVSSDTKLLDSLALDQAHRLGSQFPDSCPNQFAAVAALASVFGLAVEINSRQTSARMDALEAQLQKWIGVGKDRIMN